MGGMNNEATISMSRVLHPHLPRGVSRLDEPIGRITSTHVAWSSYSGCGKVRPVLIIGARGNRLWVRPIYTLDRNAGLWRAVVLDDWKAAGLGHRSYVSVDVVEVPRNQCGRIGSKVSLRDWNRVCRGEVHA